MTNTTQYTGKTVDGYVRSLSFGIHRLHILYHSWLDVCGKIEGLRILDMGCGDGRSSRMLGEKGAFVVGFDNAPEMLAKARQKEKEMAHGIVYHEADLFQFADFDSDFDLVTAAASIHYARNMESLRAVAKGAARALKKDARLVALNTRVDHPVKDYDKWTGTEAEWIGKPFANGSEIQVSIYKPGQEEKPAKVLTSFSNWFWKEETYRRVLEEAGFKNTHFSTAKMSAEGRRIMKEEKWGISPEGLESLMVLGIISAVKS